MSRDLHSEVTLRQYLLGEMSDDESAQVERQYLADRDFFDQLLAAEDDLIDEYLSGELSTPKRAEFERRMLATPAQREKLRKAQQLLRSLDARRSNATRVNTLKPTKTSWLRIPVLATAFAMLLLSVTVGWLFIRERRLSAEIRRLQIERVQIQEQWEALQAKLNEEQQDKSELLRQLKAASDGETLSKPPETPIIATFVLSLVSTRGDEGSSFRINDRVNMVRFQAPLMGEGYKFYRAELQTADGESVDRLSQLAPRNTSRGNALILSFPAKVLRPGDYVLKVSGVTSEGELEDAGFYSFRIVRN